MIDMNGTVLKTIQSKHMNHGFRLLKTILSTFTCKYLTKASTTFGSPTEVDMNSISRFLMVLYATWYITKIITNYTTRLFVSSDSGTKEALSLGLLFTKNCYLNKVLVHL